MLDALGYYKLLHQIGAGGLGAVYRARDTRTGRTVIIRLLPAELVDDPVKRATFLDTARRAANLSHPNVAALFEIGEDGSHLYLVYEHVAGEGLPLVLAERPMKARRALEFAIQLADALAEGHAQGIVHGDIRPEKVLVTKTGHAKLLDFGVARFGSGGTARMALSEALTTGSLPTSVPVEYMAPEQILGDPGDARTDVYCLAVVVYEMLTGRPPFKAGNPDDTAMAVLRTPAPSAAQLNDDVSPRVDEVVRRALSKSLDARPQSAAELAAALRDVLDSLKSADIKAPEEDLFSPGSGRAASRRWIMAGGILVALAAVAWSSSDAIAGVWRRWFVAPPSPVLVVLPAETGGANRPQPYFVRGFLDQLAERFAHTPGFTVVNRSWGPDSSGGEAAAASANGSHVVLRAGLQTVADTITVDATLTDTARGDELWSDRLSRPRTEVLALETDLVDRVAERLNVAVPATPQRVRTAARAVDPEGYDLFLQGQEALRLDQPARALALFRRATLADPSLAEAHASYVVAANAAGIANGTMDRELMRRAAASAAAIDIDLAATGLASGLAAESSVEAARHYKRALEIDPSSAAILAAAGDELAGLDRARALDFYRAAIELDPLFVPAQFGQLRVRADLGQRDAAQNELAATPALSSYGAGRALSLLFRAEADPSSVTLPDDWMPQPAYALKLAMALGTVRPDIAVALAREAMRSAPDYCEARAIVAALELGSRRQEARRELEAAGKSSNPLCAAAAAAALHDAASTASALASISGNRAALRAWIRQVGGESMSETLSARRYPWGEMTTDAGVVEAMKQLDQALAEVRSSVTEELRGLPRD